MIGEQTEHHIGIFLDKPYRAVDIWSDRRIGQTNVPGANFGQ